MNLSIIELATVLGVVFTAVTILGGIAERYLDYYINKSKPKIESDTEIEFKQRIKELYVLSCRSFEILQKTDESGTPLVYFPKSVTETNKAQMEIQHKIVERLADITFGQQRIAELLDRLEHRFDTTFTKTK